MSKANKNKRLIVVIVGVVGFLAVAGAAQASEPNVGDRWIDANGWQIIELMYYDAYGWPVFNTTHNVNAAISTAADEIRDSDPCVDGNGLTVGVWDGGKVLWTHQEFDGRVSIMDVNIGDPNEPNSSHATHVAGTIGAEGEDPCALGMAPSVNVDSYNWEWDSQEMATRGASYPGEPGRIYVSNHSYGHTSGWVRWAKWSGTWGWHWNRGTPWNGPNSVEDNFGQYDRTARWWDLVAYNRPYYLIFKAAGNDRGENPPDDATIYYRDQGVWNEDTYDPCDHAPRDGEYKDGYDTIATCGVAKNVMTVGAVNDVVDANGDRSLNDADMSGFSSWGPADDGRIKPDIVANGVGLYSCIAADDSSYDLMSGTSMATPDASGSAILLVEYYRDLFGVTAAMRASTLKGLIIHTVDDLGRPGPDYCYGWGLMNTKAAADFLKAHHDALSGNEHRIVEGSLGAGNPDDRYTLEAGGGSPIRVTLCWTDPHGRSTRNHDDRRPRLVNDLDLRIIGPTGTTYFPYVLDVNDPNANATTGDNILDNVEQVYIESAPTSDTYTVTVSHKGLSTEWQDYSLLVSFGAQEKDGGYWGQPTSTVKFSSDAAIGPNQTVTLTAIVEPAPTMKLSKGVLSVEVSLKDANMVVDINEKIIEHTFDENDPNILLRTKEYSEFTITSASGHFKQYLWGMLPIGTSSFTLLGTGGSGTIVWETVEYGEPNRVVVENMVTAQMQVRVTCPGFSPIDAMAYGTGTGELEPNNMQFGLRMNATSYQFIPSIVVDDFDSYPDYWLLVSVWDDYLVNGTGSEIFLETDANFTRDGNSMRYQYTNETMKMGKPIGSAVDADPIDLESGRDWTAGGVKALVLYFLGDPCTVISELGSVWPWLELEDTNSNTGWVMYPDPNHVTEPTWHEWNIELAIFDACGVALSSIERLTIGIGGSRVGQESKASTTNRLWFDDIRLYPPRCLPEYDTASINNDCITDLQDIRIMADQWLTTGPEADIVDDDNVNFLDYGLLADNWLTELLWPEP